MSVSVEEHVLRCAQCRGDVAAIVTPEQLRPVWDDVLAEIEVPRKRPIERVLTWVGLSSSDAIVVASAVALRAAWVLGVIVVLSFAVLAAMLGNEGGLGLFLVAAPLIPVWGVAAAYGPSADPSYEAVVAAPYALIRLVLLRTALVLVTSSPFAIAAGLALPSSPVVAVAWLLPAAGFIVTVLTASNWVDPAFAAAVVGVGWIVAVGFAIRGGDPLLVFSPAALATYLVLITASGLILLHRLLGAAPSWRLR
jgi:hypothetical protein